MECSPEKSPLFYKLYWNSAWLKIYLCLISTFSNIILNLIKMYARKISKMVLLLLDFFFQQGFCLSSPFESQSSRYMVVGVYPNVFLEWVLQKENSSLFPLFSLKEGFRILFPRKDNFPKSYLFHHIINIILFDKDENNFPHLNFIYNLMKIYINLSIIYYIKFRYFSTLISLFFSFILLLKIYNNFI